MRRGQHVVSEVVPPSTRVLDPPPPAADRRAEGLFAIAAAINRLADVLERKEAPGE